MEGLKRINQDTFDEVVRENVEEFDMSLVEAIKEACDQFQKQGVDLSTVDLSGGAEKQEFVSAVLEFQEGIKDMDEDKVHRCVRAMQEYLDDKYQHVKRNLRIFHDDGGWYSLSRLLERDTIKSTLLLAILEFIGKLCRSSVEIRDSFEPGGSRCLAEIITRELDANSSSNLEIIDSCLYMARVVSKSENNKVSLMSNGMGKIIEKLFIKNRSEFDSMDADSKVKFESMMVEACYVIRGLCIHDDVRRDMSCAYENGRFFNNSSIPASLMRFSSQFREKEVLAAAALAAARSLITTEESVKIMAQHGAMALPKAILGYADSSIELARSLLGLSRNLCADDVRKDKLVGDGSLQLIVQTIASSKFSSDPILVEHALACLAAMSLRSPSNSSRIVSFGSIDIVVNCMRKFPEKTSLQRQGCLLLRNIAGRCPELRGTLLDCGVENVLRDAGRYQDCVDEAYGAMRDLGCDVQRVKVTQDGKIESAYEQFGSGTKSSKFNPSYDASYDIEMRVKQEAKAPFAESNFDCDDDCDHDHHH